MVLVNAVWLELRHDAAVVRACFKLGSLIVFAGEKTVCQRRECHITNVQFFQNREQAFAAYDKVYSEASLLHKENKKVCIVAEGDAGFYSSVHYIFEKLQADNIPVQHIAGIPAFIAAGACAGLHIASQEERLTVIPGIITAEEIEKYMEEKTTIVIMKLSQCTEEVHRCIHLHPEYNYHYFENIGTEKEKYLHDTELISALSFPYFSLLIIRHSTF